MLTTTFGRALFHFRQNFFLLDDDFLKDQHKLFIKIEIKAKTFNFSQSSLYQDQDFYLADLIFF